MYKKGTLVTTWAKFTAMISAGSTVANQEVIIVDETIYPETKFKGVYSGVSYEAALAALEVAFPTAVAGDWAILNGEGLPPIYAVWDNDEDTPLWKMSGTVVTISVDNTNKDVTLTLNGSVLSADLKNPETYFRQQTYIPDWNTLESALANDGLGNYYFNGDTLNLPAAFVGVTGASALLGYGRLEEAFVGLALVQFGTNYKTFLFTEKTRSQ